MVSDFIRDTFARHILFECRTADGVHTSPETAKHRHVWSNRAVPDQTSDGRVIRGSEVMRHLMVPVSSTCWWCQERPATTGEHKFKRTDLTHLMGNEEMLLWGDGDGNSRPIRGKSGVNRDRYQVIKFPKSMCERCNNVRSKPLDGAYELFAQSVANKWFSFADRLDLYRVFGADWKEQNLRLARYYAKHFGCRMVSTGIPVPPSLRAFLDGATDMPDAHLGLVTTDEVRGRLRVALSISEDYVESDKHRKRLVKCVLAAYLGPIGMRYEWQADGIEDRSQFFHHPRPVINDFTDHIAVTEGRPRAPRR